MAVSGLHDDGSEDPDGKYIYGWQMVTIQWCMLVLTLITILPRLYIRVYNRGSILSIKSWPMSEFFLIASWLLFLGTSISVSYLNDGDMYNFYQSYMTSDTANMATYEMFLKAKFAYNFFYKPCIYMVKLSLLFFYLEICPKQLSRSVWWSILVGFFFNTVGLFITWLQPFIFCKHVAWNWSLEDAKNRCSSGNMVANGLSWAFHLFTDGLVYSIPILIIYRLHRIGTLTNRQKVAACCMFGMGFINIGTAVTIITLNLASITWFDIRIIVETEDILLILQQATAIWVVCFPYVKAVIREDRLGYLEKCKNMCKRVVNRNVDPVPPAGPHGSFDDIESSHVCATKIDSKGTQADVEKCISYESRSGCE